MFAKNILLETLACVSTLKEWPVYISIFSFYFPYLETSSDLQQRSNFTSHVLQLLLISLITAIEVVDFWDAIISPWGLKQEWPPPKLDRLKKTILAALSRRLGDHYQVIQTFVNNTSVEIGVAMASLQLPCLTEKYKY